MDQPPGYVVVSSEHLICRLQKALYGLKQLVHGLTDLVSLYLVMVSSVLLLIILSLFVTLPIPLLF